MGSICPNSVGQQIKTLSRTPHPTSHHEKPLLSHWLELCHMITLSCKGIWQKEAELAKQYSHCLPNTVEVPLAET